MMDRAQARELARKLRTRWPGDDLSAVDIRAAADFIESALAPSGEVELETTAEERARWSAALEEPQVWPDTVIAPLLRDIAHLRAEANRAADEEAQLRTALGEEVHAHGATKTALANAEAELARFKEEARKVVEEQANDQRLWFKPEYITEDTLQKALRRVHAVIEGVEPNEAARAFLSRLSTEDK